MSSLSPPPSYLDDDQIRRLEDLLDQRAVPFKGFNLEALDGFLSALVVAPSLVMPSEWQPVVWGGKAPAWADAEEAFQVQTLLMGHWNACAARVRHDADSLPEHLAPLLWLPEDPEDVGEELHEEDLDVGHDWALGFFTAVALREAEWDQWLDDNEWIVEIFDMLSELAGGSALASDDPSGSAAPIGYEERLSIVLSIPGMLADLNLHRIEQMAPREPIRREATPGRNEPCRCGSGKKYKKCCGLN